MSTTAPDPAADLHLPDSIDLAAFQGLSQGQLAGIAEYAMNLMAKNSANPYAVHDYAKFTSDPAADWSGHLAAESLDEMLDDADTTPEEQAAQAAADAAAGVKDAKDAPVEARPLPAPPERLCDTLAVITTRLVRISNLQEAAMTQVGRHLDVALDHQPEYFGSPDGVTAFKTARHYFKEVCKYPAHQIAKLLNRQPHTTYAPGKDPSLAENAPGLPRVTQGFLAGLISPENLDRIITMDEKLAAYAAAVQVDPRYAEAAMAAWDDVLAAVAAQSAPESFTRTTMQWIQQITQNMCPDGPPIAEALKKKPDNTLRMRSFTDGSGKVSMDMTPDVFAAFKKFSIDALNKHGTPITPDIHLTDFLYGIFDDLTNTMEAEQTTDSAHRAQGQRAGDETAGPHTATGKSTDNNVADGTDGASGEGLDLDLGPHEDFSAPDLDDLTIDQQPEEIVAETASGDPVSAAQLAALEKLSPSQRLTAILIGYFRAMLQMPPQELGIKRSHGAAATVTIVQDIQTAYETLGVGTLPEAVRRPPGPAGFTPPNLRPPDLDQDSPSSPESVRDAASPPDAVEQDCACNGVLCRDPEHAKYDHPKFTRYISQIINVGPVHPLYVQQMACDSEIHTQIWDGLETVAAHGRGKRLYDAKQRQAVIARDRGCQAPGCMIPAALCDLHHKKPWSQGGTTDIDNAILLCTYHHAQVHNEKWKIITRNGVTYFQPARWIDPLQPLLRNTTWAL